MRAMWLPKHWGKATLLAGAILLYLATAGTAAEGKPVIKRGWIGVSVQELTPSLRDAMQLGSRTGLLINDVVADSPADEAGLRQEDVLLEFNGEKVERVKRLSSLVRNTEPNTDVEVKIFREGEEKTVTLTVARMKPRSANVYSFGKGDNVFTLRNRPMLGVRVAELNEDLAPYFKVDSPHGVLVLQVEKDSPAEKAGLKAGDVILKIDGEKVRDYEELTDILSYYEDGEEVNLDFVRQGKNNKVAVTLDEQGNSAWGFRMPDDKDFEWNFFEKDGNHIRIMPPGSHERIMDLQDNMMMLRDRAKDGDARYRIRIHDKSAGDSI
ncbi:MAG: PDZ domain-containing protein [Deferribacteres bacterium]|nr:PDZ domain-containing protein [candidate division KSB1 bacterium]MCB9511714.1 PDZ domain-containing protein [Deferribacteres bacterium]